MVEQEGERERNIIVISPVVQSTSSPLPSAIVTAINSDAEGVQCFVRDLTHSRNNSNKALLSPSLPESNFTTNSLRNFSFCVAMAQFKPVYPDVSGHGSLITIHRILAG